VGSLTKLETGKFFEIVYYISKIIILIFYSGGNEVFEK